MSAPPPDDYIKVAEFRASLQHFLRENDRIARRHGLTAQRYLLLLMIKGAPDGTGRSTVTELSRRLQLAQHTVTDQVARGVRAGLIRRSASAEDRRVIQLSLSPKGERSLARSFIDLHTERHALLAVLTRIGI
jgi:DNA-binding MarR family transcriptional regulator